ncbi:uncharacterized protein LOC135491095 isoform X2 [Lineus longissimus]|uniref:uncharacterized protein LOC135491095 isoform X2 n=1 Tax=Lineus longissimus TaxID=88925 RepID=UPI00315D51AB
MKFPIFELAKVLSFKSGFKGDGKDQKGKDVKIVKSAWCEDGEKNQLALVLSNGYLVLRYSFNQLSPALRQIPWPAKDPIRGLCYDSRGTWLICVTKHSNVYVIPALALLDLDAQIEQLWTLNDVTLINISKKCGPPTSVVWWQTLLGEHIAIVGTRLGKVLFVDLLSRKTVYETEIKGCISQLQLVKGDSQTMTYVLITAKTGHFWKILLEKKDREHFWKTDEELGHLGYDQIDNSHMPISCILNQLTGLPENMANCDDFVPMCFYQFPLSVQLQPQYAKGRHFVTAYNRVKRTFEVFDSSLDHRPLFIYEVPKQADDVILTDKLIICSMKQDVNVRLMFISNQMAETSPEQNQVFNQQAVIQAFKLTDAVLVNIHKRALPFYWFERQEERDGKKQDNARDDIAISMHTVLEGCVVVTQHDVYECRPRVSPERYFLNLCLNQSDLSYSEQLGIMLGLDINGLYEDAARFKMEAGDFTQAMRLYKLSKCPHRRRVAIMTQHGRLTEVTAYLQQVLSNTNIDMTMAESKALADVALHCFVFMIEKKKGGPGMKQALRDFLLNNFSYDEKVAIDLLLDHYMMEQLFELAKARGPGMVIEVIKALVKRGFISLSRLNMESLVAKNMAIFLLRIGEGSFLRCMDESDLVQFMISQPRLAAEFTDTLRYHLGSYDLATLLQLAKVFDPSSSLVQMYLHKAESAVRKRTSSVSSLSSISSNMSEDTLQSGQQESCRSKAKQLIQFFFEVVLQLHARRNGSTLDPKYIATPSQKKPAQLLSYRRGKTYSHLVVPMVIGCGHSHSALIRNGELYTWGRTQDGRLGHGNIATDHVMSLPCKVETLHMLQIKVLSVSCGAKHTIALTQQGVYGWGSSQYGQVGIGDTVTRAQPMLIEVLSNTPIISVVCGQYHSLARAADSRVYSWGWGVFGQLGHSSIEDVLAPAVIEGLAGMNVVQVQAGYAHTLVLTAAGEIYGFGNNSYGQLGEGNTFKITSPKRLDALTEPITIIASKYFCSFALTNENQLYTFGCSPLHVKQNMQLSKVDRAKYDPDFYLYPYIFNMEGVEGKIIQMSAGGTHVAVLTAEGRIYSWGKNYDGQLGLGSNREYPTPMFVAALKDHTIKVINCGASHTMALDKDGQVFSFGRNEFAQLGISDQAGLENTRNIQNMGSQPNPTLLNWVPASLSLIGRQYNRRGSDDFWLSDTGIDGEEMGCVGNIPHLSSLMEPEYDVHVITTVVQHLGEYCSLTKLVRMCLVERLWGIVGDIYEALNLYAQSIQFKLREICDHRHQFEEKSVLLQVALEIVEKFLRIDQSPDSQHNTTLEESMVKDVFQFWRDLDLPFSDLEAILDKYLELLAVPLCHVITSPQAETDVAQEQCHVVKNLSVEFVIKVISHVICLMKSGDIPSDVMLRLGLESTDQRKIDPGHQQKLWQQILQNLRQDVDKMAFITMTTNDAKIITEQMEEYGDNYAIVFTCGHHFPQKHFMEHVLTRFTANFVGSLASLQQTATLLTQYYTSMRTLPMACPSCVQDHIVQTI